MTSHPGATVTEWFVHPLENIGSATEVFSFVDVIAVLMMSSILAFVVAWTYMKTHDGMSYSKDFVQILAVFGVVVSMIMLIIGSNIARAFTLVGALSIVRFRNAIKSTKDVGFIFFMMAVGMAVGTRFYMLAAVFTAFVSGLMFLMKAVNFGSKQNVSKILKVAVEADNPREDSITGDFYKYMDEFNMLSMEATDDPKINELVFLVKFKNKVNEKDFLKQIKTKNSGKPAYILSTQNYVQ